MEFDKDAIFEALYRESYGVVLAFALSLCGDCEQAEDLTQEAFLRAYVSLHQFRGGKLNNWLMRIVRNLYLDARRRAQARVVELPEFGVHEEGMEQFSDQRRTAEDCLIRDSSYSPVLKFIESLDQPSQDLLQMAHMDRLPHAEIAEKLGISTANVRTRIHRLCKRIRRATNPIIFEQE